MKIEICKNAEGSIFALASNSNGDIYRISGPKPWGGYKVINSIFISQDDLVEFICSYLPEIIPIINIKKGGERLNFQ